MYKLFKFFIKPSNQRQIKPKRVIITAVVVSAILFFVFAVPLPRYVWGHFVVRPKAPSPVVVHQPGVLKQVLKRSGEDVRRGDVIATLSNPQLELELEQLRGAAARLKSELAALKQMHSVTFDSGRQFSETASRLRSAEKQIREKEKAVKRLTIRAERSGRLFAPPNQLAPALPEHQLASWHGHPLEAENRQAFLEVNSQLGEIADPASMELVLVVRQRDAKLLKENQRVIVLIDEFRDRFVRGNLTQVSRNRLTELRREFSQSNGGPISTKTGETGEQPVLEYIEARGELDLQHNTGITLVPSMRGTAKIRVANATLFERTLWAINSLFKFR